MSYTVTRASTYPEFQPSDPKAENEMENQDSRRRQGTGHCISVFSRKMCRLYSRSKHEYIDLFSKESVF